MDDNPASHAMTEVALGLAMAFFAIMVLSMVSMSVPRRAPVEKPAPTVQVEGVGLKSSGAKGDGARQTLTSDDLLLVYHRGRFFDRQMKPVDIARISSSQRIVLALPPSLSLEQAMRARRKISSPNLIITSLDKRWTKLLEATP